ncbi:hypothetical protein [Galbibacter sp. BG1]
MKHKIQFGESLTGDLKENTWTFEVEDVKLHSGEFAIVPKENYIELITALKRCAMSMQAHPDCEPNSEFDDFKNGAWEALEKVIEFNNQSKH